MSKITVKGAPASSEQKRILRRALQLADRWNAPYKAKVALVEALIVESEAKNLGSASADGYGSYGVLQGRDIYHSRKDLMDPDYQIGVFLGRGRGGKKNPKGFTGRGNAISLSKTGMKSGDIAQAIEGSAYPDRYMQHQREAMRIVRELGRGEQKSAGVAPSKVSRAGVAVEDPALRQAALQQYLSQRKKPGALLALASGLDDAVTLQQPVGDVSGASQTNREKPRGDGPTLRPGFLRGTSGKIIGTPGSGTHTLGNWQSDNAIDLGTPNNTIITALQDGVIEKVKGGYSGGSSRFDGYQVTVRFKDGNRAFYTHLSKTHVKPGMRIRAGQAIGRSGSANGVPHLHVGLGSGDPLKIAQRLAKRYGVNK